MGPWEIWFYLLVSAVCPEDMRRVGGTCVDIYEAPNQKGSTPLVMQSAYDGEDWCESRGKRLCSIDEWVAACDGTPLEKPLVPQGRVASPGACNNDKTWMPVTEKLLNSSDPKVSWKEALRVWQGEESGSRDTCVSSTQVFDTIGNVEEWVRSPHDHYGYALMGHYWSRTGSSCSDRVVTHGPRFYYYETGFRCCSTPRLEGPDELLRELAEILGVSPHVRS